MKNVLYKNSICHFIKEKINLSLIQKIFFNYAKLINYYYYYYSVNNNFNKKCYK